MDKRLPEFPSQEGLTSLSVVQNILQKSVPLLGRDEKSRILPRRNQQQRKH